MPTIPTNAELAELTPPQRLAGAVELAAALMESDADSFKQGYTADNAALAASDVYQVEAHLIGEKLRQRAYDVIGGGNPHTLGTPRT